MIDDRTYKEISEKVYLLDPKHEDYNSNLNKGFLTKFNNKKSEILETKNEPKNGMQAMTIARSLTIK